VQNVCDVYFTVIAPAGGISSKQFIIGWQLPPLPILAIHAPPAHSMLDSPQAHSMLDSPQAHSMLDSPPAYSTLDTLLYWHLSPHLSCNHASPGRGSPKIHRPSPIKRRAHSPMRRHESNPRWSPICAIVLAKIIVYTRVHPA
jgi:hypothetical protein